MIIGITGHKGRLGSELIRLGCTPLECDITSQDEIELALLAVKPDVIINCAAYTKVDACEDDLEYEKALKVNTWGVNKLREVFEGRLIHISTDYIFKGLFGPYDEKYVDFDPVNSYGFSKVGGEVLLTSANNQDTCIVRTTGLYGGCSGRNDFAKLVVSTLSEGKELKVSNTLKGNQTYVPHLAEALVWCANSKEIPNVLNIGSKEVISRYEFAIMIVNMFGLNGHLLIPVDSREIQEWKARRPRKAGLKIKLAQKLGVPIHTIFEGLQDYKENLK
jgi:dTDP-4-dehydrorhamnose reductase